jgi:hypothetical protein
MAHAKAYVSTFAAALLVVVLGERSVSAEAGGSCTQTVGWGDVGQCGDPDGTPLVCATVVGRDVTGGGQALEVRLHDGVVANARGFARGEQICSVNDFSEGSESAFALDCLGADQIQLRCQW